MRIHMALAAVLVLGPHTASAQRSGPPSSPNPQDEMVRKLLGRLDLEKYKATIKGLTQFGDRRQGTERNRRAVDWIEAQLKSYGCPTERVKYVYDPPPRPAVAPSPGASPKPFEPLIASGEVVLGPGGSRYRGIQSRTGVNTDPNAQPDVKLRELNSEPAKNGPREEVFCTKVGTTHPEEMYILGAHMDGHGWGEAANDDGSGTALVMEAARVLNGPDVRTE